MCTKHWQCASYMCSVRSEHSDVELLSTTSESEYNDISKTTSNSGQVEGKPAGKDIGQPE